jgi:hypothetical protein
MEAGGKTLKEFLLRLPAFHTNVALIFPNLNPPWFREMQNWFPGWHIR